jgi:PKHD-type hydroxylase
MIITEPKWKSYVVETIEPIFTAKLCKEIIDLSSTLKKEQGKIVPYAAPVNAAAAVNDQNLRQSTISWLPFNKMQPMYDDLIYLIQKINRNHFGFSDIQITEPAQVSEYSKGQFYNWHTDSIIDMDREPPVRKLSMTLLLNDPSEFEGGNLEIAGKQMSHMKQGYAAIFASFLQHRVTPVTKGVRKALVVWFSGEPFK